MVNKKTTLKNVSVSIIVLVGLLLIVALLIATTVYRESGVLEYQSYDESEPGTTYRVKLDFDSGELYVYEYSDCSDVDCGPESDRTIEGTVTLTSEEIDKVKLIVRKNYDKVELASALSSLVLNEKTMIKNTDDDWSSFDDKDDYNGDGIITYREFGNSFLDSLIDNQ